MHKSNISFSIVGRFDTKTVLSFYYNVVVVKERNGRDERSKSTLVSELCRPQREKCTTYCITSYARSHARAMLLNNSWRISWIGVNLRLVWLLNPYPCTLSIIGCFSVLLLGVFRLQRLAATLSISLLSYRIFSSLYHGCFRMLSLLIH